MPSTPGPQQGLWLMSSVSSVELYFWVQELVSSGTQTRWHHLRQTHERFRNGSESVRINLVFAQVERLERPIPLEYLSDIRHTVLPRRERAGKSVTQTGRHSKPGATHSKIIALDVQRQQGPEPGQRVDLLPQPSPRLAHPPHLGVS